MRYFVFPRYINGEDKAPATARKTDKVYLMHKELISNTEGGIPLETNANVDTLLSDATVEEIADTMALAEELIQAALQDGGVV